MKPKEVQFCYAIAQGQTARARELISQIDVNQNNDWGCSPALMCLWALNRDPKILAKKLEEFFPLSSDNAQKKGLLASQNKMDEAIREVLLPTLTRSLTALLKPIGLKVVSLDKVSDSKQDLFVDAAFAAVNVILNDECFDNINASQRRFAENLFSKLLPLTEKMHAETKTVAIPHHKRQIDKEQPYTIQLLMAILNGKPHDLPNMPSLHLQPMGRTYLPGASLVKQTGSIHCHTELKREEEELRYRHRLAPGVH